MTAIPASRSASRSAPRPAPCTPAATSRMPRFPRAGARRRAPSATWSPRPIPATGDGSSRWRWWRTPIGGRPTTPCGGCRQRLAEFGSADTPVHCYDPEGRGATWSLGELLPPELRAEGPSHERQGGARRGEDPHPPRPALLGRPRPRLRARRPRRGGHGRRPHPLRRAPRLSRFRRLLPQGRGRRRPARRRAGRGLLRPRALLRTRRCGGDAGADRDAEGARLRHAPPHQCRRVAPHRGRSRRDHADHRPHQFRRRQSADRRADRRPLRRHDRRL